MSLIGVCLYKSILYQCPYLKFYEKLNDQSCKLHSLGIFKSFLIKFLNLYRR